MFIQGTYIKWAFLDFGIQGGGGGGESRGVSPLQIWADGLYCVEKLEKT